MNLKTIGRLVTVGVLVASMTAAMAQGGGFGGGQGRGQGRGGGGFGQRFGFGQGPAQLALRADVQRDINATDEQKKQLQALSEKLNEDRRAMFQDLMGGGGPPDQAEMRAAMEKFNAKSKEELGKILNEGQMKRLDEISIQLAGKRAVTLPAVQKQLGLSAEQIEKINTLTQKEQEAGREMFEKLRNGELDREGMQKAMEQNAKVFNAEVDKILTKEQGSKLTELGGKPFKADPPQGGGGGR